MNHEPSRPRGTSMCSRRSVKRRGIRALVGSFSLRSISRVHLVSAELVYAPSVDSFKKSIGRVDLFWCRKYSDSIAISFSDKLDPKRAAVLQISNLPPPFHEFGYHMLLPLVVHRVESDRQYSVDSPSFVATRILNASLSRWLLLTEGQEVLIQHNAVLSHSRYYNSVKSYRRCSLTQKQKIVA